MVLNIHSYDCTCWWSCQWVTGGFSRSTSLVEKVEKQMLEAENLKARSVWRSIYQQILKEEILPGQLSCKGGVVVCSHCQKGHEQFAFYDSNNESLHPILCKLCGSEAAMYHPFIMS